MVCNDRQLTEAQRQAAFEQLRNAGARQVPRPFSGQPTVENLIDYLNREVYPVLKQTRAAVNEVYRPVLDNAPSGNPLRHNFSELTTGGDPTSGRLKLDNADASAATTIRLSQLNAGLADVAPWLDVMNGSSTAPLGVVTLTHFNDPLRFARYDLNTMTDQGAYWDLAVTAIEASSTTPFVEGDIVVLGFIPGVGSSGAVVPPGSTTVGWDDVLLNDATSGATSPSINSGQSLIFAGVGPSPAGGDIDAAGQFTIDSASTMHLHAHGELHVGHAAFTTDVHVEGDSIELFTDSGAISASAATTLSLEAATIATIQGDAIIVNAITGPLHLHTAGDVHIGHSGCDNVDVDVDQEFSVTTALTERLGIEADGAWRIGGTQGTDGQYLRSFAALAPPQWATITFAEVSGGGWADVLAKDNNSGANNPHVDTGQFLGFGDEGTLPASGAIRSSANLTINVTGLGVLLGSTGATLSASSGNATVSSSSGQARLVTAGNTSIVLFTNSTERLEIEGTGGWQLGGSVGSAGQYIRSSGAGASPAWATISVSELGTIAAESFLGNFTAGVAAPAARAGSSVAGLGLLYSAGGTLSVGAGSGITVNADDVQLSTISAESFMGNFTAAPGVPDGRPGSSVAGDGLTYTAGGTLAVGAGTGITVAANSIAVDQSFSPTWTGTHAFSSVIRDFTTNQVEAGALPLNITLGATTNHLVITTNGDGEIQSITGATTFGRRVLVMIYGTGTKTIVSSSGTDSAIMGPGLTNFTCGTKTGFIIEGRGSGEGWLVVGGVNATNIPDGVISNAKLTDMAQSRIKGRAEGAGTGDPTDLTPTQVVAIIDGESATWTGVHSFTGSSHTINVTGAVNIDADAASHLTTSVGDLTLSATASGSTAIVSGGTAGVGSVRVDVGGTERLEILGAGGWQVNGSSGSAGEVLTSQGGSASPEWAAPAGGPVRIDGAWAADASITITPPAGATWFIARFKGGGGGGGGADADTNPSSAAGGGGGEGGFVELWHAIVSGNITGSIGGAGTAGSNAGGNGGGGGTTSVTYNAQTWSATGGSGGTGTSAEAVATQFRVAAGGQGGGHGVIGAGHIYRFTQTGQSGDSGVMYGGAAVGSNAATGGTGGGLSGGQGGSVNGAAGTGNGQDSPGGATNNVRGGGGGGGGARIATAAGSTGATGGLGGPGWLEVIFYSGSAPTFSAIT